MNYRLYHPDDFTRLYAIELACFEPPLRFSRALMRRYIGSPDSATWIAEQGDKMTGFAIVNWTREEECTIAYIQTIEVALTERRRGIATELLRCVESSASAAHAKTIWLHVAASNHSAIRLYEAHGYRLIGREEDYYARDIPALVYAKPLT